MQVTETKSEGLVRVFTVTVPAATIEESVNKKLKEISGQVTIPGFRPGKVPHALLKKKYGTSVVGEVLEQTVNDSVSKVINEQDVRPAVQPKIEITSFDDGKDLEFTVGLELLPELVEVDFSKIKLERLVLNVPEEDIEKTIANIAEGQKVHVKVEEDRGAKNGDALIIDFIGKIDGVEFDGGKAEDYTLEIGSGSFIPGFEEQLVGAKAVLAEKMGLSSLDDLRKAIREEQEKEYKNLSRTHLKRALLDALAEGQDFEVPQGMIDNEFEAIRNQLVEQKKQYPEDQAIQETDLDDEETAEEYRVICMRRIRLGLLMADAGSKNNIEVSPEDINRAISEEARKYQGQEREVMEHFKKNPEAVEQLKAPLFEEKVVDFIIELAQVTEKSATIEELLAEPDEKPKKKIKKKAVAGDADKPKKKVAPKKKVPAKVKTSKKDE
jgi:trigger factor